MLPRVLGVQVSVKVHGAAIVVGNNNSVKIPDVPPCFRLVRNYSDVVHGINLSGGLVKQGTGDLPTIYYLYMFVNRRGVRAVQGTGLENQQARKRLVGSNPTLSAFASPKPRLGGAKAGFAHLKSGEATARQSPPKAGLRWTQSTKEDREGGLDCLCYYIIMTG